METLFAIIIGIILYIFFRIHIGKQEDEDLKAWNKSIDDRADKYTAFFNKFPDDAGFIFVTNSTYNWLRCSASFCNLDKVPADLRVIRPGVSGYMYGYGIIIDEELAGTYL